MTTSPTRHRGLNPIQALGAAVRGLPDMWRGSGGVLALLLILALARPGVSGSPWHWVVDLVVAALTLAAFGALTRIGVSSGLAAARARGLGPLGFQWTRVEARLLGASLLCALFMTIMLALLMLVALAVFGAAGLDAAAVRARDWAAVGPVWKIVLLALVGLVVLATPVVLSIRLSLFAPATVGRGQMTSLTATSLTNGAMLPLLVGGLIVKLPVLSWGLMVATGLIQGGLAQGFGLALVVAWYGPMMSGFLGAAYRQLETDPAAFVDRP